MSKSVHFFEGYVINPGMETEMKQNRNCVCMTVEF